jgi:uncharacterized protein YndB with AHSA1/START domain
MSTKTNPVTAPAEREFVFTRVFDAPRGLFFKAWSDPKHVAQWWGPHGLRTAWAAPSLQGMEAGWTQSLERLEAHLAKM